MLRQFELVERVKAYNPAVDEDLINRAYVYSVAKHGTQMRASGDPYYQHPVEVAGLLADLKLDTGSIVTGLLHDTVEDTVATLEDIDRNFGREITELVDGVTKLSQLELNKSQNKQAENFRKLVLAMSKDIRVLLVKLCDRLHNMRTLQFIKAPEKRARIATETLEIYAPLAERIGMHEIKDELEDLAFLTLHPEERQTILDRLRLTTEGGHNVIATVIDELTGLIANNGIEASISGRAKRPYSIYRKTQTRAISFEELSDIMAFRVIVDSVPECYQVLGILHHNYNFLQDRFKDYISVPKANGYRSLHTGILGPLRRRIEVQVRTREMHEHAELGVAAHWAYKTGDGYDAKTRLPWLRDLLDIEKSAAAAEEFLEDTKLELFQDQVFVFTPKGMVRTLPLGATPVDFAYAVHSEVGDRCVGAKINGRLMPLRTQLKTGDQVEILTSKTATPSPEWERFVVTGKAQSRIRRFIRLQQRDEYAGLGKAMLQRQFRIEGYEFAEKAFDPILRRFKAQTVDDLFVQVGNGNWTAKEVFHAVFPAHKPETAKPDITQIGKNKPRDHKPGGLPIQGLIPGMAVHYARCCHPIPGDRIVGIVTTGKGVTIHTIDCDTLDSFRDAPERWIDLSWRDNQEEDDAFAARLRTQITNEPGTLGTLTTVIGKSGGNIVNLRVVNRSLDFFELSLDVQVKGVKHLNHIMAALRATPQVTSVDREKR